MGLPAVRAGLCAALASWLSLGACVRLGYDERPNPAAEGFDSGLFDAAVVSDSGTSDAGAPGDAAMAFDVGVASDAPATPDAAATDASATLDAAAPADASSMFDAAVTTDAASEPDTSDAAPADAAVGCTPTAARDYCLQLPALASAPQLDGVLDCGPTLIDLPVTGWSSSAATPTDNHARYAAAWRMDGLYIYVEVDDPLRLPALASDVDPWCGDGVELYADADGQYVSAPDYDNPGAMQLLAAAPAADPGTALAVDALYHTRTQTRVANWSAARHVMAPRANGYALEAFIAAADLELSSWTLAAGAKVGFDIAINVSVADASQRVGCGYYLGQYYLRLSKSNCNSDNCRPYSNAAAFCTATLE